ncbi:hypothetical protein [Streptomyces specialis]|uniref:hypothetical protein n=1 Tax=Streptomyces specialis TaxID=498367 RepID=UPI00073EA1B5|nr:hypothetical protein [Streptomyces specialis]
MTVPLGPTEIAGTRVFEVDGYRIVFYPDVTNPLRSSCQASTFYWMPERLYLGRTAGGDYDFSFTRWARAGGTRSKDVAGEVRFSLTADIPADVVDEATNMLYRESAHDDPYWGSHFYWREEYHALTFQYTHTTISNIVARAEPVYRGLAGADVWYCEKQGAATGPISALDGRSYTTLMGQAHTQHLYASLMDKKEPLTVNRTVGVQFIAPVEEFSLDGSWSPIHEALSQQTRDSAGHLTLAGIRDALAQVRKTGDLAVRCTPDASVPLDPAFLERLLTGSGCVEARFLDLARGMVLNAPENRPTALVNDCDGPPNPWGSSWQVTPKEPPGNLADEVSRPFTYPRSLTIDTRFTAETDAMRTAPATYFPAHYPDEGEQTLQRVFRPVLPRDHPAIDSVSVRCGYPDRNGTLEWQGRSWPQPTDPAATLPAWNYTTPRKAAHDVTNPPPGWEPDKTFVKRQLRLRPSSEANTGYCVVRNDNATADIDIDPEADGRLFNDIAIDISASMVPHLDVFPIKLLWVPRGGQSATTELEITDAAGNPDGRPSALFTWHPTDAAEPRRWLVFPDSREFRGFFRYRTTLHLSGTKSTSSGWRRTCGSGPLHVFVPAPDKR